jgi:hypothetical protein
MLRRFCCADAPVCGGYSPLSSQSQRGAKVPNGRLKPCIRHARADDAQFVCGTMEEVGPATSLAVLPMRSRTAVALRSAGGVAVLAVADKAIGRVTFFDGGPRTLRNPKP